MSACLVLNTSWVLTCLPQTTTRTDTHVSTVWIILSVVVVVALLVALPLCWKRLNIFFCKQKDQQLSDLHHSISSLECPESNSSLPSPSVKDDNSTFSLALSNITEESCSISPHSPSSESPVPSSFANASNCSLPSNLGNSLMSIPELKYAEGVLR